MYYGNGTCVRKILKLSVYICKTEGGGNAPHYWMLLKILVCVLALSSDEDNGKIWVLSPKKGKIRHIDINYIGAT